MASPPRKIEAFVGFFVPPACREHVLGDLHERYESTPRYVAEAILTVPRVIEGRIRRTTDGQVFVMEACVLYISFLAAAWKLDPRLFLLESWWLLRLWVPVAAALAALVLWDAYTDPRRRPPLRPILEATFAMGIGAVTQAIAASIWPEIALPRMVVIAGGGLSVLLLATLRMLFPPNKHHLRGAG
jgi:hypothetical protein